MDDVPEDAFILDPFSGTATTGLVAAERGLSAHGFDVNPFLVWLGNAKCRNYSKTELARLQSAIDEALAACKTLVGQDHWVPNIHDITRWWRPRTLSNLAALRRALVAQFGEPATGAGASDLAWIAFCRLIIERNSSLMANYVRKYFHDVHLHLRCLRKSLQKGAVLCYIVGNSSFYGVQVRTDELLMESLRMLGFANVSSTVIRKRNSKKELFEYCVRATWKADGKYESQRFDARRDEPETLALL